MKSILLWFMLLMLISGALNTLLMKFMVLQEVPSGPSPSSEKKGFEHPYFQTLLMMVGEFLCLIAYRVSRRSEDARAFAAAPKSVFAVACLFDWVATTLVNMAYIYIPASIVQMCRGAIVLFTCLLSVSFLGRRQHAHHVLGVALVVIGITAVSFSAFINPHHALTHGAATTSGAPAEGPSVYARILGISLCLFAQVFQASMIVYEEKIMSQYTVPPLAVVGMEGAFGILIGSVLLSFLNVTGIEDTRVAVYQMGHSTPLLTAVIASIFSIAFFNFSGVTVTQQASAVARSTIDVSRTILIWAAELLLGWNTFNPLQLVGFVVLAAGTMIYNKLVQVPFLEYPQPEEVVAMIKEGKGVSGQQDLEASRVLTPPTQPVKYQS